MHSTTYDGKPTNGGDREGPSHELLRLVVANLVVKNANLSNELAAARRTARTYEEATAKDLLVLARWLAGQITNATDGERERIDCRNGCSKEQL